MNEARLWIRVGLEETDGVNEGEADEEDDEGTPLHGGG